MTVDFSVYWWNAYLENAINGRSGKRLSESLRFKGIPIALVDEFKAQYKGRGYRLRWRGPRKHRLDRSRWLRQSVCTREDATTFSVYQY